MVKGRAIAAGALALAALAGCGFQPAPTTRASLRVVADPPEARVFVDDRFVATSRVLARRPHALRPGAHLLTVTASGYFPHDMELDLPAGETTVEVRLRPIPE